MRVAADEQAVFDLALDGLGEEMSGQWLREYLYSRAATIYRGTSEIQRNIIAKRLLGLPE